MSRWPGLRVFAVLEGPDGSLAGGKESVQDFKAGSGMSYL